MSKFSKGGAKAREASKNAFPAFKKTNFLNLKDGESMVVRLLHDADDWIFVNQHTFVATKGPAQDAKAETKAKWPKNMNAVCRYTKNQDGEYVFPEFADDCFICDHMTNDKGKKLWPSVKLWVPAIQRDEVKGTQAMADAGHIKPSKIGKTVGFMDHLTETPVLDAEGKSTGKSTKEPTIIVLNQGMKNFFGALQACAENYGTAVDRDYRITRRGSGLDTEYDIVPQDPIPAAEGSEFPYWTMEDPEVRAEYDKLVDIERIITEQADDRHFATFFDTTKEIPSRGGDKDKDEDEEKGSKAPTLSANSDEDDDEATSTAPTEDMMKDMRARLMGTSVATAQDD
jgi:hypothetical protein